VIGTPLPRGSWVTFQYSSVNAGASSWETAELQALRDRQLAGWKRAGNLLAEYVSAYLGEIVPVAEKHDRLVGDAQALLDSCADDAVRAEFEAAAKQLVDPFPADLAAAVWMQVQAATDLYGEGTRVAREDGGNPVDVGNVLAPVTPDLRGVIRNAELSGRVQRRTSSTRFSQGFQPAPAGGTFGAEPSWAGLTAND
jgi:hypothetical protein